VDDDSSDGSVDAAAKRWPGVKVIRRSPRVGVARARNSGAAATTGGLIVFSDAHVAPRQGWLDLIVNAARRADVGAVGPTLTHLSGQSGAGRGLTWINTALNLRWLSRGGDDALPVPLLCGCFMAVRRDAFERSGGFDERFARYGGEDVELCVRLWRVGLQCLVEPRAVVAHRFRRASGDATIPEDAIYNRLRIGSLHFSPQKLAMLRRTLGRSKAFDAADARLAASDIRERRAALDAVAAVDPHWFFKRFGLTFFEDGG
jgi:GT2 family glycosyltransferase